MKNVYKKVLRTPPKNCAPVIIDVAGFIEEFRQGEAEAISALSNRVKRYVKKNLSTKKAMSECTDIHHMRFSQVMTKFGIELSKYFPIYAT